jgi:hypothetical protein
LDYLDISDSRNITDIGIAATAQHCPLLKTVRFRGLPISAVCISALSTGCPHLLEIGLGRRHISDTDMMSPASSMPMLKKINLDGSGELSDACLVQVAQSWRNLQAIVLNW